MENTAEYIENNKKYNVAISNFEGPLDLSCFLISKNKMDIFEISLSELTDKYIEYINEMQELDMEIATEFIVMATTLLYIKSKKLLPIAEPEDEVECEITEEELMAAATAITALYGTTPPDDLAEKLKLDLGISHGAQSFLLALASPLLDSFANDDNVPDNKGVLKG